MAAATLNACSVNLTLIRGTNESSLVAELSSEMKAQQQAAVSSGCSQELCH